MTERDGESKEVISKHDQTLSKGKVLMSVCVCGARVGGGGVIYWKYLNVK